MCLWILGVIAAMTIPTLMARVDEQINAVKLKKVYSELNQSFIIATNEYGPPEEWDITQSKVTGKDEETGRVTGTENPDSHKLISILLSGLKVEDIFSEQHTQKNGYLKDPKSKRWNTIPHYRLQDGTVIMGGWMANTNCQRADLVEGINDICGDLKVDLNGPKGPNTVGIDIFEFWISSTRIIPMGTKNDKQRPLNTHCVDREVTAGYNGYGCTAYVLEKGKMPWLHGKNPSWDD